MPSDATRADLYIGGLAILAFIVASNIALQSVSGLTIALVGTAYVAIIWIAAGWYAEMIASAARKRTACYRTTRPQEGMQDA